MPERSTRRRIIGIANGHRSFSEGQAPSLLNCSRHLPFEQPSYMGYVNRSRSSFFMRQVSPGIEKPEYAPSSSPKDESFRPILKKDWLFLKRKYVHTPKPTTIMRIAH